jgi:hypothetical protein
MNCFHIRNYHRLGARVMDWNVGQSIVDQRPGTVARSLERSTNPAPGVGFPPRKLLEEEDVMGSLTMASDGGGAVQFGPAAGRR